MLQTAYVAKRGGGGGDKIGTSVVCVCVSAWIMYVHVCRCVCKEEEKLAALTSYRFIAFAAHCILSDTTTDLNKWLITL